MGRRARDHPLARAEASQPGIISFVRRRRRYARGVEQAEPETGASTTQPSRRGNHLVAPWEGEGPSRVPWPSCAEESSIRSWNQSTAVFACRGSRRRGVSSREKKVSRANYLYFPYFELSKIFEEWDELFGLEIWMEIWKERNLKDSMDFISNLGSNNWMDLNSTWRAKSRSKVKLVN